MVQSQSTSTPVHSFLIPTEANTHGDNTDRKNEHFDKHTVKASP